MTFEQIFVDTTTNILKNPPAKTSANAGDTTIVQVARSYMQFQK